MEKLYAKFSKYEFRMDKVIFLGLAMSKERVLIEPAKIKAVMKTFYDL